LSHSSPPSSNKLFVPKAALNFWIKSYVISTVQDSLTRQQFSMITSSLLQSLRIACSFTVRIAIPDHHCSLFPLKVASA